MTAGDDKLLDRFLAEDLSPNETAMLQERLATDGNLRRRLALRRQLYEDRTEEDALRRTLAKVDRTYHARAGWGKYWWLLLVLLTIAAAVVFSKARGEGNLTSEPSFTQPVMRGPSQQPADSVVFDVPTPTLPANQPAPTNSTSPPASRPIPTVPPESPPDPPAEDEPETTLDMEVFAALDPARFTPNDLLESIVEVQVRTTVDTTVLTLPEGDTLNRKGPLPVWVSTTVPPPYKLMLYDNDPESFLDTRPLEQVVLPALSTDGNRYKTTTKLLSPPAGGRYYVLLLYGEGEVLAGRVVLFR